MPKPNPSPRLTHERLREVFDCDPKRGVLVWRIKPSARVWPGDIAGTVHRTGYRIVRVDGERIREHRVIWFFVHGTWPQHEIDHKNGDPSDNRIDNLRDVTRVVNARNMRGKGFRQTGDRFEAYLRVSGRSRHLGTFDTAEEAEAAHLAGLRTHRPEYVRG